MGKDYFEFLEEEFQGLATQLQRLLAQAQDVNNNDSSSSSTIDNDADAENRKLELQLTRCQAIFQQMEAQVKGDADFQERLDLYQIQLQALHTHYQSDVRKEELIFSTDAVASKGIKWFSWMGRGR